jgi:hypothetical protein
VTFAWPLTVDLAWPIEQFGTAASTHSMTVATIGNFIHCTVVEQSARISAPQFASLPSSVCGFVVGRHESQA